MQYKDTLKIDLNSYVKDKKLITKVTVPKNPQIRKSEAVENTFSEFLNELDKYIIPENGPQAKVVFNKVCNILYKLYTLYEAGEIDFFVNDLTKIAKEENKNNNTLFEGSQIESALISILDGLMDYSINLKNYNDPERFKKWMGITSKEPGTGILIRNYDFYSVKNKSFKDTFNNLKINQQTKKDAGMSK